MYKFIKADKDATIYREDPTLNTGIDPIIEISKFFYNDPTAAAQISRGLIKFDVSDLETGSYDQVELLLSSAESTELQLEYEIFAFPIAEQWSMGDGRVDDDRIDDITGVTWNQTDAALNEDWLTPNTGSNQTGSIDGSGGIWYTTVSGSQAFDYSNDDVEMDVTTIVDQYVSGALPNHGMILKYSQADELNAVDYGQLQFFSKETHTIYEPLLRVGILDTTFDQNKFDSGSFSEIRELKVHADVRTEYYVGEQYRINLVCRELYPVKRFGQFKYDTAGCFLPEDSYYRVIDVAADKEIIPFSEYSRISLDQNGNYFNIDFSNWEVDRDYAFEIKVIQNNSPVFFNNKFIFTLID